MQTLEIKLDIADDLIAQAGIEALKKYLTQAAETFKVQLLAQKLKEQIGGESQMDADFRQAKQDAWTDYKTQQLPEHLKAVVERREKL